ncbi:MAG: DNA repair protein RadC [candidate division WOR-3 bacterium]
MKNEQLGRKTIKKDKSFTIRDLPKSERPRERLEKFGSEALSAQELLALILGKGIKGESVMMTAQKLLSRFGSLKAISEASIEELKEIRGLGKAKACQIKACFEIARRINSSDEFNFEKQIRVKPVAQPKDVYELIKSKLVNYKKEHFFVLSFDSRNQFKGCDEISVGILNENLVHPRETFEAAIRRNSVQIIIAHNHPSGDPEPSEDDLIITKRLVEAGKILGIEVIDHIIVTKTSFFSFKHKGLI